MMEDDQLMFGYGDPLNLIDDITGFSTTGNREKEFQGTTNFDSTSDSGTFLSIFDGLAAESTSWSSFEGVFGNHRDISPFDKLGSRVRPSLPLLGNIRSATERRACRNARQRGQVFRQTGQLLSDDQGNHFPSVPVVVAKPEELARALANNEWAEPHNLETLTNFRVSSHGTWFELPDRVQDEILSRLSLRNEICTFKATLCPPTLPPCPSSVYEYNPWNTFNTDEAGGSHGSNDFANSSKERTYFPFSNIFSGINFLPSPDPGLSKDYLVADGAQGLFCINVGKAMGAEKLVMYNPSATQKLQVLPPLFMHPMLMHLRVGDGGHYKVLVAGSVAIGTISQDPSLKIQEYDSKKGVWEDADNSVLPFPPFGINEYQNGVYFTDSERELLLCVGILDEKGAKGVLIYDFKKKQWAQDSEINRQIPLVRSELPNAVSSIATTHIVGCGGSIFVYSKQECEQDVYSCIHKLNYLESLGGDNMWEEIRQEKWTGGLYSLSGSQTYPDLTCGLPPSATALRHMKSTRDRGLLVHPENKEATVVAESGFMFSTQEWGRDVFISIYKLKPPDGSGNGVWEEILRRKKKRHRAPNWKAEEITAYLKLKEEGLGVVTGKDWDHISEGLGERYSFIRGSQACEDQWGTLLKRHTDIQQDLKLKNIQPDTSDWVEFWKMSGSEGSKNKLLRVFSLECYEMMDRILGVKPRKKTGSHRKQTVDGSALSSSSLLDNVSNWSSLQDADTPLPSPPSAARTSVSESFNNSVSQGDERQSKDERSGRTCLASQLSDLCNFLLEGRQNCTNEQIAKTKAEALKIVMSKLQLEILKEKNKACDCADRRPGKSRKKSS